MRSSGRRWMGGLVAVALALQVTGCAPDAVAPGEGRLPVRSDGPTMAPVNQDIVDRVTATLTCLYDGGVIPNPNSALSKLTTMVNALLAGDVTAALDAYATLVGFLQNWQSNNNTNLGAALSCPTVDAPIATNGDAFAVAFADLQFLIEGTPGDLCLVKGETVCEAVDGDVRSYVYFPPEIYQQLTAVTIENNPPGLTRLQEQLDEYPTYVRILTSGITDFTGFTNKPLVVVCFTNATIAGTPAAVLSRLLLGSLHEGTDFSLLPKPQGLDLQRAVDYCGPPPELSILGVSNGTLLGRLTNRLTNLLMPASLHARYQALAFGGVGGSASEFSAFGAVDPGLNAFGGIGGSASEFAPALAPGGPAAVVVSDDGVTFTGLQGEQVTDDDKLPTVRVATPGSQTPIGGVTVTFSLVAASVGSPSAPTFCDGTTTYQTTTDAVTGEARPPCIDFGPTTGFRTLQVSFNPSTIDPLACMITESGSCQTATTRKFLLETVEAPASQVCTLGSKSGKVNFAAFDGTKWVGYFQYTPELTGRIRRVGLHMSVTGRSSTLSDFPARITAYRGLGGPVLATGTRVLNSATGTIQLPGDNGSSYPVEFGLVPTTVLPAASGNGNTVVFKLEITAPSTRAPQLWYTTDKLPAGHACLASVAFAGGKTPATAAARDRVTGLALTINNTVWEP